MENKSLTTPFKWDDQLRQYQEVLNSLVTTESEIPIFNDGKEKAAILMSVIFRNAKNHVYIYCNALSSELSDIDIYQDAVKNCIDRGVKIKLLLQSREAQIDEGAIAIINNNSENTIHILTEEQNSSIQTKLNNTGAHFTVADGKMFRLEYDPKSYKANASFNDEQTATQLENIFNSVTM